ncbi:MAG: discoidin domain-containing protein [Cyanobacteria bacterium REEB65]|nr:discoidin domain-containing protein [Cyanobacteria bacterium REEB65]
MITAILVGLGPLVVAGWGILTLRRRLLHLKAIRRLLRHVESLREELAERIDELEEACRVADLAPPLLGMKPSNAGDRWIDLREGLRRIDEMVLEFEADWERGQFVLGGASLAAAEQGLGNRIGEARLLASQVERDGSRFGEQVAFAALQGRSSAAIARIRGSLPKAADPGFGAANGIAAAVIRYVDRLDAEFALGLANLQDPSNLALNRSETARGVAALVSKQEALGDMLQRVPEVQARICEQWPRVRGEVHDALELTDGRFAHNLAVLDAVAEQARQDLEVGDLVRADRQIRRAISRSKQLARWFVLGILDAPTWGLRGPLGVVAELLEAARLPLVWTLTVLGLGMAIAAVLGGVLGHALDSSGEILNSRGNIALFCATRSSGDLDRAHDSAMAVDGNLSTAWESGTSLEDRQWLILDLGHWRSIAKIDVLPFAVPGATCRWAVDASGDGASWQSLGQAVGWGDRQDPHWGKLVIPGGIRVRLLRIRPLDWGFSGVGIFEVRVFGPN